MVAVFLGALLQAASQPLDRVLAVVSGQVILASDARAFLELGLIESDAAHTAVDKERPALDRLIARRLMLDEVNRYQVSSPPPERIDRDLAEVRARFADADAFAAVLATVGFTPEDLRQVLRDEARLEAYLADRFGSSARLSETDLRAYYDANAGEFTRDSRRLTFEAARESIRLRLWGDLRSTMIEEWVAGLLRRGQVMRFDQ